VIVYTGGTFDLLHVGHLELLRECRKLAGEGRVIVSLNTDEFVASYKGTPPVIAYDERKAMLLACRDVDAVVRNVGGADSKTAIEVADPDIIAIGDDWLDRDYLGQLGISEEWLDERGLGPIVYIPRTTGQSTRFIRSRL
jgi:glycerol-3-phosphate cytidylyltransferase